ncbi:MAG: hypothetical protein C0467_25250 [Planctomycetaceae bacterium]|nr:hypothetical protein [Planctomycetaceae bacterium]
MLTDAGFTDATFHGWTGYVTSSTTQGGLVMARKPSEVSVTGVVEAARLSREPDPKQVTEAVDEPYGRNVSETRAP